jgi:hypothetical protein
MRKFFLLSLILSAFFLNSCLEAEVDINLKGDGSGEMRMKILPLDRSLNPLINDLEADLRKNQSFKDSDITKGTESDGRSSLLVRKKFNRVDEVDKTFKFISKEDSCEFQMIIPREDLQIVRKVTVNMPGQIIESNIKGFSSNSLIWNRTASSGNKLFVKSKAPEPMNKFVIVFVILCVVVGVALLIFKVTRKEKATIPEINFCPDCGSKVDSEDRFCQNCGKGLN